jgi:hypothetical protein
MRWAARPSLSFRGAELSILINIRPRQQNFGLEIQDPALRERVEKIVRRLLEVA